MTSYYPRCSPSEVSISEALSKIGVSGSYANRERIAEINGIQDYNGTAQQNIHLLNLLKKGKLIKEKDESDSSPEESEENEDNEENEVNNRNNIPNNRNNSYNNMNNAYNNNSYNNLYNNMNNAFNNGYNNNFNPYNNMNNGFNNNEFNNNYDPYNNFNNQYNNNSFNNTYNNNYNPNNDYNNTYNAFNNAYNQNNDENNSNYEEMLQNIESSGQFGNKAYAMIKIGELMFEVGYETAFVAGLLANIYHEGNFGCFESSKYVRNPGAKPGYLRIMDNQYNYSNKYSGKCVTEVSLKELKNLCDELEYNNWQKGKFGLGIIQWTGERTGTLVNLYLEEANGNNYINMDQVIIAEGKMVISELNNNQYRKIYENWKQNNNHNLDSENAAYDAGNKICQKYEIPHDTQNQAIKRGNTAKKIYRIMIE